MYFIVHLALVSYNENEPVLLAKYIYIWAILLHCSAAKHIFEHDL